MFGSEMNENIAVTSIFMLIGKTFILLYLYIYTHAREHTQMHTLKQAAHIKSRLSPSFRILPQESCSKRCIFGAVPSISKHQADAWEEALREILIGKPNRRTVG